MMSRLSRGAAWCMAGGLVLSAGVALGAGGPAMPESKLSDKAQRAWRAALLWHAGSSCGGDEEESRQIKAPVWDEETRRWNRLDVSVGACGLWGYEVAKLMLLGSELGIKGGHFDALPTDAFNPEAWGERDNETASTDVFGVPLWTRPIAGVEWDGFNPEAMRRAFQRLYVAPGTDLEGVAAQVLYDVTLRDHLIELAADMARVMDKRPQFEKAAQRLVAELRRDPDFSVYEIAEGLADEINGKKPSADGDDETETERESENEEGIDMFTVGQLLRRQVDGTFPVMRTAIRMILKDYDPATFRRLKDRL